MYLTAQRVRRIRGNNTEVGIDAFLHCHENHELPNDIQEDRHTIDRVVNQNPGKLIAESVDLVPGGNSVLSFVDIVGREGLNKERIQEFLDRVERDVNGIHSSITRSSKDIVVRFEITFGLQGQELREYIALTERAMRLFESPEPPRWHTQNPWIVIRCDSNDDQNKFSVPAATTQRLKQIHGLTWTSARVSVDRQSKDNVESTHSDLIQHIAPILTGLTLEQIAAQGGLILHDSSIKKKIKWPELTEI